MLSPRIKFGLLCLALLLVLTIPAMPILDLYIVEEGPAWISGPRYFNSKGEGYGHVGDGAVAGSFILLSIVILAAAGVCLALALDLKDTLDLKDPKERKKPHEQKS